MMHIHANELFHQIWQEQMYVAAESPSGLQIADIATRIWQPAFAHCQNLLDQLHGRTIKFSVIDSLFQQYTRTPQHLKEQLRHLFIGVSVCLNLGHQNDTWITRVVNTMQQYWSLCQYSTAAIFFLELKKNLKLTGNFQLVERLATRVMIIFLHTHDRIFIFPRLYL